MTVVELSQQTIKRFAPSHSLRPLGRWCLITAFFTVTLGGFAQAPPDKSRSTSKDTSSLSTLPLRDVVLFNSGVAYYQLDGEINGSQDFTFSFRPEQINDLLKSLVLFDPEGQVRPVTYPAPDSLEHSLGSLGVSLGSTASLSDLLRQLQGVQVSVSYSEGSGASTIEARVVSVNTQTVPGKDGAPPTTTDFLNLMSVDGSWSTVPVSQIQSVKVEDERRQQEFVRALDLLATGNDQQKKSVTVHFGGDKHRTVKLGYLMESPIWKTSYRLVLGDQAPYLQGWAVVENTTDDDWKEVRLSLVSGRPVSFVEDLSTPLYVPRPVVQPQVVGSPLPQINGAALDSAVPMASAAPPVDMPEAKAANGNLDRRSLRGGGGGFGGGGRFAGVLQNAQSEQENIRQVVDQLAQSVAAEAQGSERGELFEYALAQPITISSHQAAMVPIVGTPIGGEKVSIYNPSVNPQHPLNAYRLKNTSGLHLAGGPITVFDDGIYGGDGQIETLQPDESRLISYAVDLAVEGKSEAQSQPEVLVGVKADSGVLTVTRRLRQAQTYTLRNKDKKPRTVLVEQPTQADWKLVQPAKPEETTADRYRFRVEIPAQSTGKLEVVLERPLSEGYSLRDADLNFLESYAGNGQLSARLRAALKDLVQLRRRIVDLQTQRDQAEAEIKTIGDEQGRIRENMKALDRTSDLYRQYVAKLGTQEGRIDALRAKIEHLQEQENAANEDLRKYIDTLHIVE